jgi:hypothetical protein
MERIKDIVVGGGGSGDFTGFKKQFIATSFWFYLKAPFVFVVAKCFCKNLNFFLQIKFLVFLYFLNMLMSKTIFLFKKIISMHFQAKSILKTNHYHNAKQAFTINRHPHTVPSRSTVASQCFLESLGSLSDQISAFASVNVSRKSTQSKPLSGLFFL